MRRAVPAFASVVALVALAATAHGAASSAQATPRLTVHRAPSPAGPGSAQPRLLSVDGVVAMSWLERYGRGHRLKWSRWDGRQWAKPVTIAAGDSFFVNWADFPSVHWLGGSRFAAHWLWKSGVGTYAYDVRVSHSEDNGHTWSRPITPHRDGTATEHGFASLLPDDRGFRAVWLDGRNFAGRAESEHAGANMTLRTAVFGPGAVRADERELDDRCCECCATAAVKTRNGVLVAYRDRSAGEIRDIALVRREGGRWTAPYRLHADGWKIAGCPVNGPAMDANGDRVVIAWFTAPNDSARVFAAFSGDGGKHFGKPIRVDAGNPMGRVGTALLDDGSAAISWLEGSGSTSVQMRRVAESGRRGDAHTIAVSSQARASGFPQIVRSGDQLWFAWTAPGPNSLIRVARTTWSVEASP
jgi:hypothetical protein